MRKNCFANSESTSYKGKASNPSIAVRSMATKTTEGEGFSRSFSVFLTSAILKIDFHKLIWERVNVISEQVSHWVLAVIDTGAALSVITPEIEKPENPKSITVIGAF